MKKNDRHHLARQPMTRLEIAGLVLVLFLVFGGLVWWKTSALIDCTSQFGIFTCLRMVR